MAMKKSRKRSVFVISSSLKNSTFTAIERDTGFYLVIGNQRSMKLRYWKINTNLIENDFRIKEINTI